MRWEARTERHSATLDCGKVTLNKPELESSVSPRVALSLAWQPSWLLNDQLPADPVNCGSNQATYLKSCRGKGKIYISTYLCV